MCMRDIRYVSASAWCLMVTWTSNGKFENHIGQEKVDLPLLFDSVNFPDLETQNSVEDDFSRFGTD